MSYILDALRKSDEQRRRGSAPTLLTPQIAPAAPARSHSLIYALLALVTLAAGIAIGTLRPWQSSPPSASQPQPPLAEATRAPASPADAGVAPSLVPEPAAKAAPAVAQPASPPAADTAAKAAPSPLAPAKKAPESAPRPRKPAPEPLAAGKEKPAAKPAAKKAETEPALVAFSELPVPVQQEIPRLAITVHAYSANPSERLVGINDQVLREGASVTEDLKIERITPDGMIMTYKGYRFWRGAR